MATSKSVQKELDSLRREMAGIRQKYVRLKRRAGSTTAEAADRFGAIRDGTVDAIEAIRESMAKRTGVAVDEISSQLSGLRDVVSEYSDKTERTVSAHPFATVAGAIAVGYLIGRFGRR